MNKLLEFFLITFALFGYIGNIWQGGGGIVVTKLTEDITDVADTIPVASTNGFTEMGIITIGDERIVYTDTDDTNFKDKLLNDMLRGADGTTAAAHEKGAHVYTTEASMGNQSMAYNIAVISDTSGVMGFPAMSLAVVRLLGSFLFIDFSFLGEGAGIFNSLWTMIGIAGLVFFALTLLLSRRT